MASQVLNFGTKQNLYGLEGIASINPSCPYRLVPKRELAEPGRNCFHESFLALSQLGAEMKTCRAWKKLPLSILPGPTG
jgi:hypothetical protein